MRRIIPAWIAEIVLGILSLILLILCVLWLQAWGRVHRLELFENHQYLLSHLSHSTPLTPADASIVQAWMTFTYIDLIFKLPPTYLQQSLDITDTGYPNFSIAHWARASGTSVPSALLKVQEAIQQYPPAP